jgi:hypothetical protein
METLSGFIACDQAGYQVDELSHQRAICHDALRSLNGFIRYVRKQQQGLQEYGTRALHDDQAFYYPGLPQTNSEAFDRPANPPTP